MSRIGKTPVESCDLSHVDYDPPLRVLYVWFHSSGPPGVHYEYYDVPREEYDGLMGAPSHGKYFHRHIKDKYRFKKVG